MYCYMSLSIMRFSNGSKHMHKGPKRTNHIQNGGAMLIIKKPFSSLKNKKDSLKLTKGFKNSENIENDEENKTHENTPLTQTNNEVKAENGIDLDNCTNDVKTEEPNSMVIMKFTSL